MENNKRKNKRTALIYHWILLMVEALKIYMRCVPDLSLNLLRTAQELLQLLRYTGLLHNYGIYCIYNNDLEVHSYVENT